MDLDDIFYGRIKVVRNGLELTQMAERAGESKGCDSPTNSNLCSTLPTRSLSSLVQAAYTMAKNKADAEPVLYANTSNAAGASPSPAPSFTDAASNTARPACDWRRPKLPLVRLPQNACVRRPPRQCALYHLDEANLLDEVRFEADAIYTYTGTVLLALNPYKSVGGLYDEGVMDGYRGRALGVQPPHVYAIAERARRAIATGATDQSIVVSGESGAGKTESCRAIVQYLAHHSKHASGDLASALLAANPLIEAFGCAATTRNKNSSRFGKLMQIWTSAEASSDTLNASSVVTYLLEKGRVSHHAAGEQTFHAFYYLHAAAADSGITLPWLNERVTQESAMRLLHPAALPRRRYHVDHRAADRTESRVRRGCRRSQIPRRER